MTEKPHSIQSEGTSYEGDQPVTYEVKCSCGEVFDHIAPQNAQEQWHAHYVQSLEEQLEAAQADLCEADAQAVRYETTIAAVEKERDAIGAALGEPCAECGHIDWRSDGYLDDLLKPMRQILSAARTVVEKEGLHGHEEDEDYWHTQKPYWIAALRRAVRGDSFPASRAEA